MPELSHLTRVKRTQAMIDLGDGDLLAVVFDANKLNPVWLARATDRQDAGDSLTMANSLAEIILEWDVTLEGQPFPPTSENLAQLSFTALGRLVTHVIEAALPSEDEKKGSSKRSSIPQSVSTPPQPSSPNGPASSESQNVSASLSPT